MKNSFVKADEKALSVLVPDGINVRVTEETGSTNSDLYSALRAGERRARLLAACRQTAGRGRRGRDFSSGEGGIFFSFTVSFPVGDADAAGRLTPLAGIASADAINELYGLDARIKWVNDIYVGGKKLCGILAETFVEGGYINAVVGIGINGENDDIPDTATLLRRHTDRIIDANELIGSVVRRFYDKLPSIGSNELIDEYRALSCVIGKTVTVRTFDGLPEYSAKVLDIDRDCSLIVLADGEKRRLISGEVSLIL